MYISDFEMSLPESERPSPEIITPSDSDRQMANFRWNPKVLESCDGNEILLLPRPNIPLAPLARPFRSKVGAHENKK